MTPHYFLLSLLKCKLTPMWDRREESKVHLIEHMLLSLLLLVEFLLLKPLILTYVSSTDIFQIHHHNLIVKREISHLI